MLAATLLLQFAGIKDLRWSGWYQAAEVGEGLKVELLWLLPSLTGDLEWSHTSQCTGTHPLAMLCRYMSMCSKKPIARN